ncbi:unnamed protein product [Owenia fusiformis]|uniref:Uncharacterized protein n=1 Tax=Owenia fusiformis TaxID=6347 RepID=A0A8J1Y7D8_OWEFU|nr:unnamed protein product [Owenia fusiformis]
MAEKELVLTTLSSILHVRPEAIDTSKGLPEIGLNSLHVAQFIIAMKKNHYVISLGDIITERLTINDIVSLLERNAMKDNPYPKGNVTSETENTFKQFSRIFAESNNFIVVSLNDCPDRDHGKQLTLTAFTETHPWISPLYNHDEITKLLNNCWTSGILEKNISVAAVDKTTQKMVACCINANFATFQQDLGLTEEQSFSDGFLLLQDLIEMKGKLEPATLGRYGGNWMYQYSFAVDPNLSVGEKLEVSKVLLEGIPVLAKEKGFVGVAAKNANPITCLLDEEDPNVECVDSIQVNQYTRPDGTQPFKHLPDIERVTSTVYKF